MRTVLRRAVLILAATLLSAVVLVLPARADLCATAPVPVSPKSGLVGLFTTPPANIPASAPDPFKDPKVPLGDVYGFNWTWANYDLGCGTDYLRDPTAVINTRSGNLVLSVVDATTAGLASLEQMSQTAPLNWLSDPLHEIALSLREPILSKWFPLAAGVLAVFIAFGASKLPYHKTARIGGVLAVSVLLAVFALLFPVVMSNLVDKAVTTTASASGSLFSASPVDTVNRESNYRTWLTGNFGDPDSVAARKYGPRLVAATQYTWSDWQRMEQTPAAKKEIDAAKATDFQKIAKSLQAEDPSAYEVFTGRGERTAPALYGIVSVAASGLFVAIAAGMVLFARVMMQVFTLIAPLAAVVAILPKQEGQLARLWDLFTACLWAVFKFTLAGGVMAVLLGAVQTAEMSGVGRLFFVVVLTVAALFVTKPLRAFKTLVPGLDPNDSYIKKLVDHVGPALAGGVGSYAGVATGLGAADDKAAEAAAEPDPAPPAPSLDPLPAPVYTWTQPPAEVVPRAVPVELDAAAQPAALPVGSVPESRAEVASAGGAILALPVGTSGAALPVGSEPAYNGEVGVPDVAAEPPVAPSVQQPEDEVVEPTGIITQTDPGLYHSGPVVDEYLVPVTSRELTEDGEEHERVVFHSRTEV